MRTIYCCNCLASNSVGRDVCNSCGLPLPEPGGLAGGMGNHGDEENRERMELLEGRVANLSRTVEELLKYIHSYAEGYDTDIEDLDELTEYIAESNAEREAVEEFWQNSIAGYLRFIDYQTQHDKKINLILSHYDGENKRLFAQLVERAQMHFLANQYKRCLRLIERAMRLSPGNHELLFFLGEKMYLMNQPEKAISAWMRVLSLKPDHYRAALMCGIMKLMSGSTVDARHLLKDAIRQCNDGIVPLLALATLEFQEGCFSESERYVNLANRVYETAFGHVLLAETFIKRSHPKKAISSLERAADLKPNDKRLLIRLATQYLNIGYLKRAKETFSQVSMLSPKETFFRDLATCKSTPEMFAAIKNNEDYNPSNYLMHSVSELLINELE